MGYIMDLRKVDGSRPIIMVEACVILLNKNKEILLQLRRDNNCWGQAGGSLEMGETPDLQILQEYINKILLNENLCVLTNHNWG